MTFKAVGFDYGGVTRGLPGSVFAQKVSELLNIPESKYRQVYYSHNQDVHKGKISWSEAWKLILNDLDRSDKLNEVNDLIRNWPFEFNQQILSLVDHLRSLRFKVGLLSNNTPEAANEMRKVDLDKHFDVFQISAETGYVKPDPQAFKFFAESLGVDVKELIFIDDSERSLSTAAEVGYTPILYKNYTDASAQLSKLLDVSL